MDLTRLAVDAGQFINRAVQYTGESLGQADKTELDPGLEEVLARADTTKTVTDQIISQTEVLLQPNPRARLEDRLYGHLDWSIPPRPRAHEVLGDQMTQAGLEIGSNTPYGMALLRCGEVQKQLGKTEGEFVQSTKIHFLAPLRSFTEGEYRVIQDERRMLLNKRLDVDIAKTRLRKAHEADREARDLNANPMEDDYLSQFSYMFSFLRVKWLKIWAQEISQAEMELRICQSLFDRQSEITRQVLEGISSTHINHTRSLIDFVEAQACYFDQCNQHAQELHKQLASIPAVFCSNNWQLALSNTVNQPSTTNHVANEPSGLNRATSGPIVVHHLQEFDQDSWTVNPLAGTEKTTTDSSVTTQLPDRMSNNNNNNTFSTVSQTARFHLACDNQSSNQTYDEVCMSDSNRHPADQLLAPHRAVSTCVTASRTAAEPPASSQTPTISRTAVITNGTGSAVTVSSQRLQLSGSVNESLTQVASETITGNMSIEQQMASETVNRQPNSNGEDVPESSALHQDVVQ
ncbi:endophilin-B1-like [Mastacembelus armatus]|uniref:Endophilin-B1-like n=1 Tax=Mastacembelus armatus TaxID=205130 RepID=A0A3Q3KYV1_9TELE|nr:endophilin-B1-like [Mastacembelus armatus]